MENRYLYKAKRKDNGEWVEGYYQKRKDAFENDEHLIFRSESYHTWEYAEVDPKTLCQCTGLTDKNGKLIWENDIVKHFNDSSHPYVYEVGTITWDKVYASFERTSIPCNVRINSNCDYEVIDSIFDNPELLEVQV